MFGLLLGALAAAQAPQDSATRDTPVYTDTARGVSVPRPFDDWVFEPGGAERTTTVILHPRGRALWAGLWGAVILAGLDAPLAPGSVADRRLATTWPRLLGRHFRLLGRDSLTLAGLPAVRLRLSGTFHGAPVAVEEYLAVRDSELILLQFYRPRTLPQDSLEAGFRRTALGLTIRAPPRAGPGFGVALPGEDRATARGLPASPWQAASYDARVRYDTAAARLDFAVRAVLVNTGTAAADSVAVWVWPALALDSVRVPARVPAVRAAGSVAWIALAAPVAAGGQTGLVFYYHVAAPNPPIPGVALTTAGAWLDADWLPRVQPQIDSAGEPARRCRPRLTLRFDLPRAWQAVAPGRLVAEAASGDRRVVTWTSDGPGIGDAPLALGPYRAVRTRADGVAVTLWLRPDDPPAAAYDSLLATVRAAWRFCSRAFGRLPASQVSVATTGLEASRGSRDLLLLGQPVLPASAAGAAPGQAGPNLPGRAEIFREIARSWWGGSVAAWGPGAGLILEGIPAWTCVAAGSACLASGAPRDSLLRARGVVALEAARRVTGDLRLREALRTLALDHRNGWVSLTEVLEALGPGAAEAVQPFLF